MMLHVFGLMTRKPMWLSVVLGLVASLHETALSQETDAGYSHLKVLEPLIGTWRRTVEPPSGGNMFVAEWIIDGSFIGVRNMREKDGSRTVEAMTMIYWNEKLQRIESHSFARENSKIYSTWTVDGDTLIEKHFEPDDVTIKRKVEGDILKLTMIVGEVPPIEFSFKRSPRPAK